MMEYINDTIEEISDWWDDFYTETFEENEFLIDLQDGCSTGVLECYEYVSDLPMEDIALIMLTIFVTLYIIFRIFYWIFGDAEIW